MTVGERIVETRKAKGISQKQFSEMTGIPIQTLFRIEKNGNATINNMQKIAEALETTPSYLMGWEEKQATNEETLSSFTTQELAEEIARRG